jgi:hypothetical protein
MDGKIFARCREFAKEAYCFVNRAGLDELAYRRVFA